MNYNFPSTLLRKHHFPTRISRAFYNSYISKMLRFPASRIALEEADLANIIDPSAPPVRPQVLLFPFQPPVSVPNAVTVDGSTSTPTFITCSPLPPPAGLGAPTLSPAPAPAHQPFAHLPYGPERESIILTNLHIAHLESINSQLNTQSILHNSTITRLRASHNTAINYLQAQLNNQTHISTWRQGAFNNAESIKPNPATDLMQKYADLCAAPISTLAGVRAAESAFEPGVVTEMNPPIATILGIEGQPVVTEGNAGPLCGAEVDVAAVLGAEAEVVGSGGGAADARSGTSTAVTFGAEGAGEGDGMGLKDGRAAVPGACGESGGEGMEGEARAGGAYVHGAGVVKAEPRRWLLGRLRKILRI
jgi:hypothetical protein